MNLLKSLLALLAFSVVVWIFTLTGMADGVLQNVGGTTQQSGSVPISQFLTNNSTIGWTNTGNIQGATLNVGSGTSGFQIAPSGFLTEFKVAGAHSAILRDVSWLDIIRLNLGDVSSDGTVSLTTNGVGGLVVGTNITAMGTVTATNGYIFPANSPLVTLTNIVYTNVTLNFGSTATLTFTDLPITVQNLKSNDVATINPPAISQTNGIFSCWVSNTTLFARYHNYQATAVDPASGIFNVQVFQYK